MKRFNASPLVALLLVAVACSLGCSKGPSPMKSSDAITYFRDVKPIVDDKCITCHQPGAIAPFALQSFDDLNAHKAKLRAAVASRKMPPWLAGKGCSDYYFDRSLTDDQIAKLTGWVDNGAPAGNPADYVAPPPAPAAGLSRVDRTLMMPVAYTPALSPDDYRCFVVDWPETAVKFVSGFRANPGTPAIVHHVIAFLAAPADVASYQQLDAADPAPGYTCFGGPGNGGKNAQWVGAWAPGASGGDFVPNTGIKILPGSKIILQVHYNTSTVAPEPDLTSLDFKLEDTVAKQAVQLPWTNYKWAFYHQMPIPAGNPDVMQSYSFDVSTVLSLASNGVFVDGKPFTIYGTSLHMHTRGTHAKVELDRADGTKECMLDIPRWDFQWQGGYGFTQPKVYNPGDSVYLECHWDNSQGEKDLNWGEGTGDEMCLSGFYITQ